MAHYIDHSVGTSILAMQAFNFKQDTIPCLILA